MQSRILRGMTALCGLALVTGVAHAQQAPTPAVPPGTQSTAMPAGSVPVHREGAPHAATDMMQAVGGSAVSNTVSTAATPGVLDHYGLPSLDAARAGNLAGLASYCVRNHLVHGTTLRVVGRKLAMRPDVKNDQYYSLGGKGLLQTSSNVPFDVSSLDLSHRTQLCAQVGQVGQKFIK
ncbi:DUF2501 domain-containing protein [Swaminathania salitolerans]|uniref:DUF2501 domain-containing protein n=1 Tax=Swaminathania salitolerans TaxID=182838 RepID=A0A511BR49_9PROT|nr:DUF2501 domain-containing protein [Swaminathania salitolerans]GBQ12347.1 hypothetical protein AA21291_1158 [Swaminathania salitolerans LMG 21291]GEL02817.1 hypothetical protein SSA02_19800 [Swaminathania salitolerans]